MDSLYLRIIERDKILNVNGKFLLTELVEFKVTQNFSPSSKDGIIIFLSSYG